MKRLPAPETDLIEPIDTPVLHLPMNSEVTVDNHNKQLPVEDLSIVNGMLKAASIYWEKVDSMWDLRNMVTITIDLQKHRRALLKHQYGFVPDNKQKGVYDPLD